MKIKRTDTEDYFYLEVKRCYLPFILSSSCPECKTAVERDLEDQYLMEPCLGGETEVWFCCSECNHEWDENIIVDVTIKHLEKN